MMKPLLVVLMSLACLALPVHASQREGFEAALELIERGGDPVHLRGSFNDYALEPYLEYFYLRQNLKSASAARVQRYLSAHDDIPAARRLRSAWLLHLGQTRRWNEYLSFWEPSRDTWLRCYWVTARVRAGIAKDATLVPDIVDLWTAGQSQPKACDPAFEYLKGRGELTTERRYRRALLAVEAGNHGLAKFLARDLRGSYRAVVDRGVATIKDPARALAKADSWQETSDHKRIVTTGLNILVKRDSETADAIWRVLRRHWSWEPEVKAYMDRRVALLSATDFGDDALQKLQDLSKAATDKSIHEWSVRVALHHEDWQGVLSSIEGMPSALSSKARWRYWQARALEASGSPARAERLYRDVSQETNYYGFLAADRLDRNYAICPLLDPPDGAQVAELLNIKAFDRAVELFHIGESVLARSEWRLARSGMDAAQRQHAAVYADSVGWHDQAIHGLADLNARRYYSVRFPLGYQPEITAAAQRRSLDPELIYGILRSESAFAPDAVSRVGAMGLMQLMPGTATQVARSERLPYRGRKDLLNPSRNIELGTAYLESLAERFDGHPLLVAAAYNAGPKAVERWLARGEPVEPDIWIETLPYRETREYVSKVIAFTAIYDWRLNGRFQRLADRMRVGGRERHVSGSCTNADKV